MHLKKMCNQKSSLWNVVKYDIPYINEINTKQIVTVINIKNEYLLV